ncbi:MAG: hypothetical protein K0R39_1775 [Symbiobacteriaceae bacterium]|jgi:hypothetical protein|nr:hypothetical protein [Symbiobacteriaceae bacterium]
MTPSRQTARPRLPAGSVLRRTDLAIYLPRTLGAGHRTITDALTGSAFLPAIVPQPGAYAVGGMASMIASATHAPRRSSASGWTPVPSTRSTCLSTACCSPGRCGT